MDIIFLLECILLALGIAFVWKTIFKASASRNLGANLKSLPGPFSLPLLGHVQFLLKKEPYKYLTELSDSYGDVYQLKIGVKTVVVLNTLDAIREAFNEWTFCGRPNFNSFQSLNTGHIRRFTFMTMSPEWKFLRKNSVKALSLFSSSRNSRLQSVTEAAVQSLHQDIASNLNKPFDIKKSILECVSGVIGAVNFGTQFNRNDPMIEKLIQLTDAFANFIQIGAVMDYFPLGALFMRNKIKKFQAIIEPLNIITDKHIVDHKYNKDKVCDVADALYKRQLETTDEELREANINIDEIKFISKELFSAGFASTMESLTWTFMLLARFPEVQERVAKELEEQLELGAYPTLEDITKTPYTEATILEALRFSSLVPTGLPHTTVEACSFRGYCIPEGAIVFANIWKAHHDPNVFDKPYTFDPSRFIRSNGSLDTDLTQSLIPFSTGKRRCVGENLARQELYLLFSSTVRKFVITPVPGETIDVENPNVGFTRRVNPYKLVFTLRTTEDT